MDNVVVEKSFDFSVRIVNLYKYICENKKEYVLSKQLLRSGTSIGANIAEAEYAQSDNDFVSKLSIALKETAESQYWLKLLNKTDYLSDKEYNSIYSQSEELRKILSSIILTSKEKADRRSLNS